MEGEGGACPLTAGPWPTGQSGWPADWFTPYTFRTIAMLLTTSCPHGKPAIYPVTPKSSRPPTLRPPACRSGTRPSLSLYAPTADSKQQRQHSAAIGPFGLVGRTKFVSSGYRARSRREPDWPAAGVRTAVPFLVVFLAVHPSTYRTAGLKWGTAASTSTSPGTTSAPLVCVPFQSLVRCGSPWRVWKEARRVSPFTRLSTVGTPQYSAWTRSASRSTTT